MRVTFPFDGHEHLGIGYLAAVARRAGHAVRLVHVDVGDYVPGYRVSTPRGVRPAVARIVAHCRTWPHSA